MTRIGTIVWRGITLPGYEYCQLSSQDAGWQLEGKAIFTYEGQPCQLDYHLSCDTTWHTISATVWGWVANTKVEIQIHTDSYRRWWLNQHEQPQVGGSIDLDLNFSPSTNLIPIRRLTLALGEQADITAAWLRFPSFSLESLQQRYTRLGESIYRYESGGGSFSADLQVNPMGLVLDYPGIWLAEASAAG